MLITTSKKCYMRAILVGCNAFCLIELVVTHKVDHSQLLTHAATEMLSDNLVENPHQKFCDVSGDCCTAALVVSDH